MNLNEAYTILELSPGVTPEEAKKKYRELTKKWHPDINKEPEAEDKFKKINEAYQCVQNGKGNDKEEYIDNPFSGFGGFNPFGSSRRVREYDFSPIVNKTNISFKESVTGCKRDIKYARKAKCQECNGEGISLLNNGCDKCGGRGQITGRQGMMIFTQTCDKCHGKVKTKSCEKCAATGVIDSEVSIQVTIPPGIRDGNILKLGGMGHFMANFMGMEQHSDAFLQVEVANDPDLTLIDDNVVSNLTISLLESLKGCKKTVKTIMGDMEIEIKPQSKNKDEVIIPKLGVNLIGNQRVIIDIKYPLDISKLIEVLEKEENQ